MKLISFKSLFVLLGIVLGSMMFTAYGQEEVVTEGEVLVQAVPTSNINLRGYPGPDGNVVTTVGPTDTLRVCYPPERGEWIYIVVKKGSQGYEGFVSDKQVKYIGPNSVDELPLTDDAYESEDGQQPDSLWPWWLIATIFVVSMDLCVWMYKWYDYRDNLRYGEHSVWPGYTVVILSLAALVYVCWRIVTIRAHAFETTIWDAAMVLSVGIPAAVIPWRIAISAMDNKKDRTQDDSARRLWGITMAYVGWLALMIPIGIFVLEIGHPWHIVACKDTFWNMILFLAALAFAGVVLAKFIWPVVVKYLFDSMPQVLLLLANFIVAWAFFRFAHGVFYDTFSGFNYLLGLFLGLLLAMYIFGTMCGELNEVRCPRCHSFAGHHVGTTDLGTSISSHTETRDISNSSIRSPYGGEVSNAKSHVRVFTQKHSWQTHHICGVCGEDWTMTHSSSKDVGEQELKRTYDVTY